MKSRMLMLQRFNFKIRDRRATHIGHAHAKHERINQVADNNIATLHTLLCEPIIRVQRVMIHRDHAKQMIIGLRNRFTGPMAKNIAYYEIFEISAEWSLVCRHDLHANCRGDGLHVTLRATL